MKELKIEPKFRDLIPKLTDAEYAQLEKNILKDGRIKEPIVTWNKIIIDGHHRYYVARKHPEITFDIEEKDFKNEHEAMVWACTNQLGRRNLSDNDRFYLIGKQYEEEKLAHAGTGANRFTVRGNKKIQSHHCDDSVKKDNKYDSTVEDKGERTSSSHNEYMKTDGRTSHRIAEQHGVGSATVERSEQFAKGVDIADSVIPGMKEEILHGDINVPKNIIRKLPKITEDKQKDVVEAISENKISDAKAIINDSLPQKINKKSDKTISGMESEEDDESDAYGIDDMVSGIRENWNQLQSALNQMIVIMHPEVLEDESNKKIAISELENIIKGVQRFIAIIKQ